ncbi:DUF2007 domain-containing protein [Maribacter sp. 2-571]|uniref:DUF2007 domain-containing protein n=1 Tax=Maribacter sp. 2-571 TaxID=3417569 RepID=UPI003D324CE0
MDETFVQIFSGNNLLGKRILGELQKIGIDAIVKDEAESARLAGFSSAMLDQITLLVHRDQEEKALETVSKIARETE